MERFTTQGLANIGNLIFSHLDNESFGRSRLVCKQWKEFLDTFHDHELFRRVSKLHAYSHGQFSHFMRLASANEYVAGLRCVIQFLPPADFKFSACNLLYDAAQYNQVAAMEFILTRLNHTLPECDTFKETLLHRAAIFGRLNIFVNIFDKIGPVNPRNYAGKTPLHYAAEYGHEDIVCYLIKNLALKNPPDYKGDTPLHLAVKRERHGVVQVFCNQTNLHLNYKNQAGKTPLMIALEKTNPAMVAIFHETARQRKFYNAMKIRYFKNLKAVKS